jgi:DNA-binding NarL/FixJ family response regulator
MNIRQGAKPWLAHAQYQYAAMLNARNASGDRRRAAELLDQAQEIASALTMHSLSERIRALHNRINPVKARIAHPAGLSRREVEVLRLVAQGKANHEIAARLFVSKNTVAKQVRSILIKTNCANRTEAAAFALNNKILSD